MKFMHDRTVDLRRLDLNLLTVFDAVVSERSVSRAANLLSLTQPAVSHALGRLRAACGDAILERYGRAMVPTPRATALHGEVRAILARAQRVFLMASVFDPASSERVFRIGASDYAAQIALPQLVQRARSAAPLLRIEVHHAGRNDGPDLIRSGVLDVAIGVFNAAEEGVRTEMLLEEPYACAMAATHPLAGRPLTLQAYLDATHIQVLVQAGTSGAIEEMLGRAGARRKVAVVTAHFLVAVSLLAGTDLILTAPRGLFALGGTVGLKLRKPPFPIERFWTQLAYAPRHLPDPGLRWLRDQLVQPRRRRT